MKDKHACVTQIKETETDPLASIQLMLESILKGEQNIGSINILVEMHPRLGTSQLRHVTFFLSLLV